MSFHTCLCFLQEKGYHTSLLLADSMLARRDQALPFQVCLRFLVSPARELQSRASDPCQNDKSWVQDSAESVGTKWLPRQEYVVYPKFLNMGLRNE